MFHFRSLKIVFLNFFSSSRWFIYLFLNLFWHVLKSFFKSRIVPIILMGLGLSKKYPKIFSWRVEREWKVNLTCSHKTDSIIFVDYGTVINWEKLYQNVFLTGVPHVCSGTNTSFISILRRFDVLCNCLKTILDIENPRFTS